MPFQWLRALVACGICTNVQQMWYMLLAPLCDRFVRASTTEATKTGDKVEARDS